MRILEIGDTPFVSIYLPESCDYFQASRDPSPAPLTLKLAFTLSGRVRNGHYDLIVYHTTSKVLAPWDRPVPALRRAYDTVARTFSSAPRNNWYYFHRLIKATRTPLVVIDSQDVPRINKSELAWLDRCHTWFMRELPVNHYNLFLNIDHRSGDVINILRNPVIRRNLAKIQPLSLGYHDEWSRTIAPAAEKIHDVFYSGSTHTTTVRARGLEELGALRDAGLRVHIPETRLPREEYLRTCSQAWLVWSPEGQGWDCHRHYEALQMGSVPLINYPTIDRWQPLLHGQHCLLYPPEPGELTRAIRDALRGPEKLRKIAADGLAHIRLHHARPQLTRHILDKVGLLSTLEGQPPA